MSSGDPQASDNPSISAEHVVRSEEVPAVDTGTTEANAEAPSVTEQTEAGPKTPSSDATVVEARTGASAARDTPLSSKGANAPAARGLGVAKPASPNAGPLASKIRAMKSGTQAGSEQRTAKNEPGTAVATGGQSGHQGSKAGRPGGNAASSKPMGPTMGPFRPGKSKVGAKSGSGQPNNIDGASQSAAAGDQPVSAAELEAQADRAADAALEGKQAAAGYKAKVALPNLRQPLSDDLQAELDAQLATANVSEILSGPAGMAGKQSLEEGQRVRGKVLKLDDESVYVALGGPDEGAISRLQFTEETLPKVDQTIEVILRGFNNADGLYNLVVPGQALDVSDWEDLEEGTVVEAHIAAANTGGLEATVGNIRAFIPISQIAQYRVEDASDFVGQRLMCLVTECNPRRKNLVLSHRAILEREREEQRQQQLEKMEPGDVMEGTVRSIRDFGVFVDLGGMDGLIHVTKLSWDHVKTPGDVMEVGQKVKVKVEKVDKQTGKISLSYRDLMENPWDTVDAKFPVGSVHRGSVSRLANFGAFVRLGSGIEGLVHISEVAGHRVSNVNSVLKEGEEVTVKILSIERDSQRIALSIKQAQSKASETAVKSEAEEVEPPRELAVKRQHDGPLKGGVASDSASNPFGLNW